MFVDPNAAGTGNAPPTPREPRAAQRRVHQEVHPNRLRRLAAPPELPAPAAAHISQPLAAGTRGRQRPRESPTAAPRRRYTCTHAGDHHPSTSSAHAAGRRATLRRPGDEGGWRRALRVLNPALFAEEKPEAFGRRWGQRGDDNGVVGGPRGRKRAFGTVGDAAPPADESM